MIRKLTDLDLVEELVARDVDGKYGPIIAKALQGHYHDFKHPPNVKEPKVDLVRDLKKFPELSDIMVDVLNCEYDEADNTGTQEVEDLVVTIME